MDVFALQDTGRVMVFLSEYQRLSAGTESMATGGSIVWSRALTGNEERKDLSLPITVELKRGIVSSALHSLN